MMGKALSGELSCTGTSLVYYQNMNDFIYTLKNVNK